MGKKIYKCYFCDEYFETPFKRLEHIQEKSRCNLAGGQKLLDDVFPVNKKKGE